MSSVIYSSTWYNLDDTKDLETIAFLIQHSQRRIKFSAYGMYDLSMETFSGVSLITLTNHNKLQCHSDFEIFYLRRSLRIHHSFCNYGVLLQLSLAKMKLERVDFLRFFFSILRNLESQK